MEVYEGRLHSFDKPKSKSKTAASRTWPHPDSFVANPRTLAEAGFYYNPSKDNVDNVKCFICGRELGGWNENDNPFEVHVNKAPRCPWAVARCSLEFDVDSDGNFTLQDSTRLPSNKILEKARLDTFGIKQKWWPHDSAKNHGATSKQMAKAGFVYTPQNPGDDTATCFYCNLSLSGWDSDDDPTEEHHKREEKSGVLCYFFKNEEQLIQQAKEKAEKAEKGPRKSRAPKVAPPLEESEEEASQAPAPKRGRSKSTTAASSSNRKKTAKPPVNNDYLDDIVPSEDMEEDDDPALKVRSAKSTRKSTKKAAPKTSKSASGTVKGKGRAGATSDEESGDNNLRTDNETKPSRTRTKTGTKEKYKDGEKPPSNVDGKATKKYEDFTININEAEEKRKGRSKAKEKSTRGKSRSKSKSRTATTETPDKSSASEPQSKPLLRAASRVTSFAEVHNEEDHEVSEVEQISEPEPSVVSQGQKGSQQRRVQDESLSKTSVRSAAKNKPIVDIVSTEGRSDRGRSKKAGTVKTSQPAEEEEGMEADGGMEVDDTDTVIPQEERLPPSNTNTKNGAEAEAKVPMPIPMSPSDFKIGPPKKAKPLSATSKIGSIFASINQDIEGSFHIDKQKAVEKQRDVMAKNTQNSQSSSKESDKPILLQVEAPSSDHGMDIDDNTFHYPLQTAQLKSTSSTTNGLHAPEKQKLPTSTQSGSSRPVTPEAQIIRASPPSDQHLSSYQNRGQGQDNAHEEAEKDAFKKQLLANAPPSPAAAFLPALASKPLVQPVSLTEEERSMTVEQWIRHEMLVQHKQLQEDGEKRIKEFLKAAEEVRAKIEAL